MADRWVHNISGSVKTYRGVPIADNAFYKIELANLNWYQTSDDIMADLTADDIRMSADGSTDYSTSSAENIAYLLGAKPLKYDVDGNVIHHVPAFTSKKLPDGKKLYKRLMGSQHAVDAGSNTFIAHTVSKDHVKMIGLKIMNGEALDYTDVKILDSTSGTYTGTPNQLLNQYGFTCNVAKDMHYEICNYDADLYYGMQIQFIYNSVSAKTIGINFDLNEVV